MTSWRPGWPDLPPALAQFWTERHLPTLATLRADGRPHVVPVGCAIDIEERCAWVIASRTSRKVRNIAAGGPVAVCQVDGARWSTIEGLAHVVDDEVSVARAVQMYAGRYRQPRVNPERVAIRIEIERFLGSTGLFPAGPSPTGPALTGPSPTGPALTGPSPTGPSPTD